MLRLYQIGMIDPRAVPRTRLSAGAGAALLLVSAGLAGCAGISDGLSLAFVDPAKYNQYDCKQLEAERKALGVRAAELQGLIAKADTGVGGAVVAELAYRNDYTSNRASSNLANEVWRRDKCAQGGVAPATPAGASASPVTPQDSAPGVRSRGGVY